MALFIDQPILTSGKRHLLSAGNMGQENIMVGFELVNSVVRFELLTKMYVNEIID